MTEKHDQPEKKRPRIEDLELNPETLEDRLFHGGLEIRVGDERAPHMLLAADLKATEQQEEWVAALSVRGGLELAIWRDHGNPPRVLGFLFEYYEGAFPYGQFFQNDTKFYGVGVHFSP